MDFLWDKITEWLKEMLIGGIVSNLSGMFDATNQKVAEISGQVGLSPQAWNGSIFSMMRRVWITSSSAAPKSSFGSSAVITITATASRWMMESLASAYRVFPTRCCATGSETRYFPPTMSCWPT